MKKAPILKYLILLLLLITTSLNIYSQKKDSSLIAHNTFYVGFANEGALYSLNFDRVFSSNDNLTWSYIIGFSIMEDAVAMPIGVNAITGKNNSHLEFSFTIIPYIDKYQSFLSSNDLSDKYIYLVPGIGYRFQKPQGGFFFKSTVSPTILLDPPSNNFWKMEPKLKLLVGVGLGYTF